MNDCMSQVSISCTKPESLRPHCMYVVWRLSVIIWNMVDDSTCNLLALVRVPTWMQMPQSSS